MYIVALSGRKVIFSIHGAIYSESRLSRYNVILSRKKIYALAHFLQWQSRRWKGLRQSHFQKNSTYNLNTGLIL